METDLVPFEEPAERAAAASMPLAIPGHVFTVRWLQDALGLGDEPQETAEYKAWNVRRNQLINRWRDVLLAGYRIHVEDKGSRGYVVIAPSDTPFVAVKVAIRSFGRIIRQASDKIQYAPDGLSDRERQDRLDTLAYLGKVELAVKHARPKPPRPGGRTALNPQG